MEKSLARELMKHVLSLSAQLNLIIEKVETIPDEEERTEMRRHMGKMMQASDAHLYRPLVKQYPDLDPLQQ